jgi:hypothetical protein
MTENLSLSAIVRNPLTLGQLTEMGGTCSAFGGEERRIHGLVGKPEGRETTWETKA